MDYNKVPNKVANKVALVTGGESLLGTAICRRLFAAGFKVATTYAPQYRRAEAWLAGQRDDGFDFLAFKVGLSDYADCERMVQELLADTGRLDVLVNNGATMREPGVCKMLPDDWTGVLHANLDSAFNVSKQVAPPMTAQRWGRIINIAPPGTQPGGPGQAGYTAARASLHGFTRSLALELGRHGITVNTVSPGYLCTSGAPQVSDQQACTQILPRIPLGRLGQPDEVAALVSYLVSEEAAFVTGAQIAIDGGQYLS
jgi:acetoacetyl-CoA reductase